MRISKLINRVIEYGCYVLFFVTPLLFNPSRSIPSFELFEWNKMMFVYGVTVVVMAAWIIKMILAKKILIHRTPFEIPLILFFFSQILATLFSIDRHVSLFGYYSRFHGGLLSTICYVALYFVFVSNREVINIRKLLLFILASGSIVAGYGIAEKFGIDAHLWVQDVRNRVFSTLGQPNWLAAYVTTFMPLSMAFFLMSYEKSFSKLLQNTKLTVHKTKTAATNQISSGLVMKIGFVIITCGLYICLLFTKSRSGFLGFWVANVFFLMILFWQYRKKIQTLLPLLLIINAFFLILNYFLLTPFSQYNHSFTKEVFMTKQNGQEITPAFSDTGAITGVTDSADIRKIVWQGAIDITQKYPLFGTGPETFAYAYYKYRPLSHNLTSEWDFLYNRAHNEFLNIAATSGLVGLGTYLFFIITVILVGLRYIHQHSSQKLLLLSLLAGFISILVTNFFGFSVVVVGLFFFLIPAILWSIRFSETSHVDLSYVKSLSSISKMAVVLTVGGTIFVLINLGRWWMADSAYARSLSLSRQEAFEEALPYIHQAIALRNNEPVYHDELGITSANVAALSIEQGEATQGAVLMKEAVAASSKALTISPQNVNFWKNRTKILFILSSYDPTFVEEALKTLQIAQELSPTDPKITYNKAVLLGHQGKNQEAIELLQQTLTMKPDYKDAYIALSIFYEDADQIEDAISTLQTALMRVNPNDQELKEQLSKLQQ